MVSAVEVGMMSRGSWGECTDLYRVVRKALLER